MNASPPETSPEIERAIGQAVQAWSQLEHDLSVAFAVVTRMDLMIAGPVFFSPSGFRQRVTMLREAITFARLVAERDRNQLWELKLDVIQPYAIKADSWAWFRNRIVHERVISGCEEQEGHIMANVFRGEETIERSLSTSDLLTAVENIRRLRTIGQQTAHIGPDDAHEMKRVLKDTIFGLPRSPIEPAR